MKRYILLKIKESEGNSIIIRFTSEHQANQAYLAAETLQSEEKIHIKDIAKENGSSLRIKAKLTDHAC